MINKTSRVIEKSEDELERTADKIVSIPNSKVLSKAEETEVKSQLAAFQYTIEKCSMGHLVDPEIKGILDEFEKADFDFEKMPAKTRNTFKETYNELSFARDSNPSKFKNTAVSGYCLIYEFLTGVPVKNLLKKIKHSKAAKKLGFGKEGLSYVDSLEAMLYDNDHNLNKAVMSSEGLTDIFKSIGSFFKNGKGVKTSFKEVPGIIFDVRNVLTILCILLLIVTAAIVIMIIINMAQTNEMAKLLEELTSVEIQKMGGPDLAHQQLVLQASENMNDNLPISTKKMLIKPVTSSIKSITKYNKKHPHDIEEVIDTADKSTESYENYIYSYNNGLSTEGAMDWIKTFVNGKGFLGKIALVALICSIVPLLRMAAYFIKHFKFRVSAFFKGQNEWISNNIEYLMAKVEDPNTPEEEKKRLNKVIERQKGWAHNFTSISNAFYKDQIVAANDAKDEVREEEKIDFDKLVEESDTTTLDANKTAPIVEPTQPNLNEQPILVF